MTVSAIYSFWILTEKITVFVLSRIVSSPWFVQVGQNLMIQTINRMGPLWLVCALNFFSLLEFGWCRFKNSFCGLSVAEELWNCAFILTMLWAIVCVLTRLYLFCKFGGQAGKPGIWVIFAKTQERIQLSYL